MGYGGSDPERATITAHSHDGGLDGVIKEDTLGLDQVVVQAKRYNSPVDVKRLLKKGVSPPERDGHAQDKDAGSANSRAIGATEDDVLRRSVRAGGRDSLLQQPLKLIREFAGSLDEHGTDKGVFFTTDKFTGPALDFARSIKKHIVLIDGPELARLMVRHRVGVTVTKTLPLARLDSDYFDPGTEA
jgi:restriction system protein